MLDNMGNSGNTSILNVMSLRSYSRAWLGVRYGGSVSERSACFSADFSCFSYKGYKQLSATYGLRTAKDCTAQLNISLPESLYRNQSYTPVYRNQSHTPCGSPS